MKALDVHELKRVLWTKSTNSHFSLQSKAVIQSLTYEIYMASSKYNEKSNRRSKSLTVCKNTTDYDKLILEHFVVISYNQSNAVKMVNKQD